MSYFLPVNGAQPGLERFEPARVDQARFDHEEPRDEAERERFEGARSERRERHALMDEVREFRQGDGCEREAAEVEPERDPRRRLM